MTTRSLGEQIRGALVKVITSLFLLLLKEQFILVMEQSRVSTPGSNSVCLMARLRRHRL